GHSAMNCAIRCAFVAGCCLYAAACTKSQAPSTPTAAPAPEASAATSSITVPRPLAPAVNVLVPNLSQPVTLVVGNAVITQGAAATYTFEVASDAVFATKVYTKTGVTEASNGQTSLTIDRLGAGADYFWRARAEGGGTVGPFSAGRKFTIGPAIILNAPALSSPASGAATTGRPALVVINATRSGPVGAITYRFELANTNTFSPIISTVTMNETA